MRDKRETGQIDKHTLDKPHRHMLNVLYVFEECMIYLCYATCLILAGVSIWLGDISILFLVIRAGFLLGLVDVMCRRAAYTYDVEVQFEYDGIWVTYHKRKKKFVDWREFKEIAIVYENSVKLQIHPAKEKICCVKSAGKKDSYGRWNYDNVFTCYNFVVFPYSAEIIDCMKVYCPLEIVDLRRTPEYSELNRKWMSDGEQERVEFLMNYSLQKTSEPENSDYMIYEYMCYVQGAGHFYYFEAFSDKVEELLQALKKQMPDEFYNNCFEAYCLYQKSAQGCSFEKQDQYIIDHAKEMESFLLKN